MVACMVCCAPGHLVAAGGSTKSRSVPTLVPEDMARCSIALTKLSCLKHVSKQLVVLNSFVFSRGAACDVSGFVCFLCWLFQKWHLQLKEFGSQTISGRGM